MMKTAMQQLIDELNLYKKDGHTMLPIDAVLAITKRHLPIERRQLEDAFNEGENTQYGEGQFKDFNHYFKTTYNE